MKSDISFEKPVKSIKSEIIILNNDDISIIKPNYLENGKIFERERDRSLEGLEILSNSNKKENEIFKCKIAVTLNYFFKKFDDIKIIDGKNVALFESVINLIKFEGKIAMDTEHYKEASNKLKTSTLQISTPHKIFIFDMVSIMNLKDWEIYVKKLDYIFKSDQILKLVYEPIQDLKVLNYSAKYKYFSMINRVIDLAEIKNEFLEKTYKLKIKGLKGLVQVVFGKTLDKVEQTSDWLQRPLNTNQIEYAALDSFILFKLYLKINIMYSNKFYDFSKVYELNFMHPSSRTNVVQSRFKKKEETLVILDEI